MKRIRLTVYSKGHEVNSDIKELTEVEYNELVKEVERAQAGQTESFQITNSMVKYFIPKKQLKRSIITISQLNVK